MSDIPAQAPICEHFWAWVSPAGTSNSARICQLCHKPDPEWLNEIGEYKRAIDKLNALKPDDFKSGQEHLPVAFRQIDYRDVLIAVIKIVNSVPDI